MTQKNPGQILTAIVYIDERNEWCGECLNRLSDSEDDIERLAKPKPGTPCTECIAFAAGVHTEQGPGFLDELWNLLREDVYTDAPEYQDRVNKIKGMVERMNR
jgi:hypothetical protein